MIKERVIRRLFIRIRKILVLFVRHYCYYENEENIKEYEINDFEVPV